MLRDAQFDKFAVYIVCGHTDLRYGIDSLAAIIETRFHMSLFVPNTLFLFCGGRADRIKGLSSCHRTGRGHSSHKDQACIYTG